MRTSSMLVLSILLATLVAPNQSVHGSDLSEFLHAVFEEHHQRPPSGAEIQYHANVSRTNGPLESYILMVSSNDFFVSQCQRNSQVYVNRLHRLFLGRDPRPDELRFWVNQYAGATNRADFVRQFCQANNVYSVPGAPVFNRPTLRPSNAVYTADALLAKIRVFNGIVSREFGGTRFGRGLLSNTARLQAASSQYRDTVASNNSTPQQVRIAGDNLERALLQVEAQFRSVPSVSDQCRNLLWDISELVTATKNATEAAPPDQSPVSSLQRDVDQLLVVLRSFASSLSAYQNHSPAYSNLNRDVNGLYVQAQGLAQMTRTSTRQSDLNRVVNSINTQGREIGRQLVRADARLRQGWWNVQHQLERVTVTAGGGGDFHVSSGHPVIINRPSWNRFPGQVSTGHYLSAQNRQVVEDADQLLALIDQYTSSLRPLANRNRDAATMINQVLDLRHDVLILRQKAAAGAFGSQLQYASRDVTRQYSDVASETFARMVGNDSTLNSPTWMLIGQATYQIDKAVRGG